uniref:uncharacterized protein LOC120332440 n=1 Tax=Styela clava TaxID=7725 RepID=UPI0019394C27|nr:uncharacterized protein LOC120332440 [Styela clava]
MDIEAIGLPTGWEVRVGLNGRIYYYSKQSQIVQILPPPEIWRCKHNLPYGWEMAIDYDNKNYYINHITQTVTYEDPRTEDDQVTPAEFHASLEILRSPQPREYEIERHHNLGFGFIAGSEKPVVIRSVTPGGPSEDKLLPDDQIVKIGSENVMMADRERVIELIREKTDSVTLTVLQPNRSANSSFLNPTKKTIRSMDRPKVRFADDVIINGQERVEGSSPLLVSPGVLRIELEINQTRSFQFLPETTAGDAVAGLCDKLGFKDPNLFSLVLSPPADNGEQNENTSKTSLYGSISSDQTPLSSSSPDSLLIAPWDCLSKVVSNPSFRHHSCHFRLEFMPKDFHKLARNDPEAFRYLYMQCVNDVVSGDVYTDDLNRDEIIKLASIQMQELVLSALPPTPPVDKQPKKSNSLESHGQRNVFRFSNLSGKLNLKYIEKEYGLRRFLPPSLVCTMQRENPSARSVRKSLQQHLKASMNTAVFSQYPTSPVIPFSPMSPTSGNADTALLQLRLQYLKILSPHHLFGGRYFSASMQGLLESDITILVGHHYGISQMINSKTKMVSVLSEFHHVTGFEVAPCQAESSTTIVKLEFADKQELQLSMEPQAAHNFAFMVAGYCRVYGNIDMVLTLPISESTNAPIYFGPHKVKPSFWNYPPTSSMYAMNKNSVPDVCQHLERSNTHRDCDFSEPVTPAVIFSKNAPFSVNTLPKKSVPHRPATPPPLSREPVDFDTDDVEYENDFAADILIHNTKSAGNEFDNDKNNNESLVFDNTLEDATYEEIHEYRINSSPESRFSSPGGRIENTGNFRSILPVDSDDDQVDIPSANGYLIPTPPSQRSKRYVVADVEEMKMSDSGSERDWTDLMKVLGAEDSGMKKTQNLEGDIPEPLPPPPRSEPVVENNLRDIIVPPPPSYPPPKIERSESTRSDKFVRHRSAKEPERNIDSDQHQKQKQRYSTSFADVNSLEGSPTHRFSSFKPSEDDLKVFSQTRKDTTTSQFGTDPSPAADGKKSNSGSHDDNQLLNGHDNHLDPVTRQKLQETEDLIKFFRQRREECSSAEKSSNKNDSRSPVSSQEFGSSEISTPRIVTDIAAGNKRLRKAEKAANKNRKSWAGSETLPTKLSVVESPKQMSMSNPDLSSFSSQKKRGRSLFRRIFGDRKRRSHSMYESSASGSFDSAFGSRRRRRFRLPTPKFRLRRAFTFNSGKRESRKTVLPTETSPSTKSRHFSFRPFSKKSKSHGMLVISEPCDGVRGVDLLPSGKYTVAGTMFGDANESGIITVDNSSRHSSKENLKADSRENIATEEINKMEKHATMPTSSGVKMREALARDSERPLSFSTFHQSVLEGQVPDNASSSPDMHIDSNHHSPCELSLTESCEALNEMPNVFEDDNSERNRTLPTGISVENDLLESTADGTVKPTNKLNSVHNPVIPRETSQKTSSLPIKMFPQEPAATSTPIQRGLKKKPSTKRPAPPPPIALTPKPTSEVITQDRTEDAKVNDKSPDGVKSDSDEGNISGYDFDSLGENSLVTEIFSYLKTNNTKNQDGGKITSTSDANTSSPESALPYDENYIMPGLKATNLPNSNSESTFDEERIRLVESRQKTMAEIFREEMISENSRLYLFADEDEYADSKSDKNSNSDSSHTENVQQGSYDVTYDDVTRDNFEKSKHNKQNNVLLKSYKQVDTGNNNDDAFVNLSYESVDGNFLKSDRVRTTDSSNAKSKPPTSPGSYFTYQNLITPQHFNKNFSNRTNFNPKPPLPPKPIFH